MREEEHYFIEKRRKTGGAALKEVHWRKATVEGGDGFSLVQVYVFVLAELFAGLGEILFSSCSVGMQVTMSSRGGVLPLLVSQLFIQSYSHSVCISGLSSSGTLLQMISFLVFVFILQ